MGYIGYFWSCHGLVIGALNYQDLSQIDKIATYIKALKLLISVNKDHLSKINPGEKYL